MRKCVTLTVVGVTTLLASACNYEVPRSEPPASPPVDSAGTVPSAMNGKPPAATKEEGSLVAAVAKSDPPKLRRGEAFMLLVEVRVDPGWHIYAMGRPAGPAQPSSIDIKLPPGLDWDGNWTSTEPTIDASSEEPSFIHEGTLTFRRKIRVARDVAPGPQPLRGTLHFQACDRFSCHPPAVLAVQAEVQIIN